MGHGRHGRGFFAVHCLHISQVRVARDSLQPRTLRVNAFWLTANS